MLKVLRRDSSVDGSAVHGVRRSHVAQLVSLRIVHRRKTTGNSSSNQCIAQTVRASVYNVLHYVHECLSACSLGVCMSTRSHPNPDHPASLPLTRPCTAITNGISGRCHPGT